MNALEHFKARLEKYNEHLSNREAVAVMSDSTYHELVAAKKELEYVITYLSRVPSTTQSDYTRRSIDMLHPSPLAGIIDSVESQKGTYGDK